MTHDHPTPPTDAAATAALLGALSFATASLLGRASWEEISEELLARLGEAAAVCRVMAFKIRDDGGGRSVQSCRFEWLAPGVASVKDRDRNRYDPIEAVDATQSDWMARRQRGELIQAKVRDLGGLLRQIFDADGALSVVSVPVMVHGDWWGHINFYDCQRERIWPPDQLEVLKTAARLLGAIVERGELEEQLNHQREALHQADKIATIGSLLGGVAHELNNPLAVVIGQALLLEDGLRDDPERAERAAKLRAAAERCSRTVKSFLDIARQQPLRRQALDLNQLTDAVLDLTGYATRSSGIQVCRNVPAELPPLWGDPHQISQLLLNLVINAQQALETTDAGANVNTNEPSARKLIRVSASAVDSRRVAIEVADSGPGIEDALKERALEPFFTTKPAGLGAGIGLSMCANIARRHGARLRIADAPEGGALLQFELPIAEPPHAAEHWPADEDGGQCPRVLVVDDEPEIVELLSDILQSDGVEVVTASSGRDGLAQLRDGSFALILSDVRMPDLDGPGFYREISARFPQMRERLVFVTGDILNNAAIAALGNVPVIEKPFLPADVRKVVSRYLGGA